MKRAKKGFALVWILMGLVSVGTLYGQSLAEFVRAERIRKSGEAKEAPTVGESSAPRIPDESGPNQQKVPVHIVFAPSSNRKAQTDKPNASTPTEGTSGLPAGATCTDLQVRYNDFQMRQHAQGDYTGTYGEQVRQLFGPPSSTQEMLDGASILKYAFAECNAEFALGSKGQVLFKIFKPVQIPQKSYPNPPEMPAAQPSTGQGEMTFQDFIAAAMQAGERFVPAPETNPFFPSTSSLAQSHPRIAAFLGNFMKGMAASDPQGSLANLLAQRQGEQQAQAATPFNAGGPTRKLMIFGGRGHATYLGCLNCSESETDSVFNKYGPKGSALSTEENLWKLFSDFRSAFSEYSACNMFASDPPVIVDSEGNTYGRLTINKRDPHLGIGNLFYGWLDGTVCK